MSTGSAKPPVPNSVGKHLSSAINWLRLTRLRHPRLRKALGAIVAMAGLAFVAIALHGQFAEFSAAAVAIVAWSYVLITLLATLTVLVTAALHARIVGGIADVAVNAAEVRYAYAVSQIARYVPGKIFGVMLEAQMLAPALGMRVILSATLLQTLLVYAWATSLSVTVLGAVWTGAMSVVLLAPVALALIWFAQRDRWLQRLGATFGIGTVSSTIGKSTDLSRRSAAHVTSLLALQWLPFFAIWIVLAGSSHGIAGACWLAASYLLASIGGALLVLIPSGLVVREAAFVWLAGLLDFPLPSLLAWAVVVRLVLTLADVLAVPLLWSAQRGQRSK